MLFSMKLFGGFKVLLVSCHTQASNQFILVREGQEGIGRQCQHYERSFLEAALRHFCLHLINQNIVMSLHVPTRKAGKLGISDGPVFS